MVFGVLVNFCKADLQIKAFLIQKLLKGLYRSERVVALLDGEWNINDVKAVAPVALGLYALWAGGWIAVAIGGGIYFSSNKKLN